MEKALLVLKKYWQYESFKASQEDVIQSVLNNNDTIALMPTGGGKSLCYQIPGLVMEGICLIISPLIALMQDQVNQLSTKGIKSIAMTGTLNQEDLIQGFDNLQFGGFKFLFLSPEKLRSTFIQQKLKQLKINLIAVDEAHCISEWGHDFRPAYLKINEIKNLDISAPILALTATANEQVINDISKQLKIPNVKIIRQSLERPNLELKVVATENVHQSIEMHLKNLTGSAIIYENSRKGVKVFSDHLNKLGFKSAFYHGGMSPIQKTKAFTRWFEGVTPIMVATNAFGMGINKDNVRQVFHLSIPQSLENYMQESGRAGRDGSPATAFLYNNPHLINNLKIQHSKGQVTVQMVAEIYKNINSFFYVNYGEKSDNFYEFNLEKFCDQFKLKINSTINVLKLLEKEEILSFDEGYSEQSKVKILINSKQIFNVKNSNSAKILTLILRTYGGVLDRFVSINEHYISKNMKLSINTIKSILINLDKDEILKYQAHTKNSRLQFLVPREDSYTLNRISKSINQRLIIGSNKLNKVLDYVTNTSTCRNRILFNYFGEKTRKPCLNCDICKLNEPKNDKSFEVLKTEILIALDKDALTVDQIVKKMSVTKSELIPIFRLLLDSGKIKLTSQQKLAKIQDE